MPPEHRSSTVDRLTQQLQRHQMFAQELIGLTEADARERVKARGIEVRVIGPDTSVITADLRTGRVNLYVSNGLVEKASTG